MFMENGRNFKEKIPEAIGITLLLGFYFAFFIFVRGRIPDAEILLTAIKELYEAYGYYLVFFGAILEGTFLIGLYVPGSATILLGASLSKTGVVQYPIILVLATLGLLISYSINYLLGKYGWYHVLARLGLNKGIDIAKEKLEKNQAKTIFLGYFHPGSASFLSTAAGILKMPFKKFLVLSFLAQSLWAIFWGSLAYFLGLPMVEFLLKYFVFVLPAIIAIWMIRKFLMRQPFGSLKPK